MKSPANGLAIDSTSKLDIGSGDLDLSGGSLAAVTALAARGYNLTGGAKWNGTGITSSAAASDSRHLTAVGVISDPATGAFDGDSSAVAGDILVKYTYFGDANLSGKVDGSDYSLIDAGYAADKAHAGSATGWYSGDFNYDGAVDGSDYALIDNAFNNQASALKFNPSALIAASAAQVSISAAAVTKSGAKNSLPLIPVSFAHQTVKPVALFKGTNQLPPYFFSSTPITASDENAKDKKNLAESVVDSIATLTK